MKKIVLIGLLAALSTSAFANSFSHQARMENNADQGYSQLEWTLANGEYNITDDVTFVFDVDRDIFFDSDNKEGWDTKFGIHKKLDTKPTFLNKEWSTKLLFEVEYDSVTNQEGETTYADTNYIAGIAFNTQTENEWDITLTPKLKYSQNGVEDTDGSLFELNTQLFKDLGAGFTFYSEIYQYYRIDGDYNSGSGYSLDYEQYVGYTKQLATSPFYFFTEFGVEAYNMFNIYDEASIDLYINPQLQYRTTLNDSINIKTYLGATIYDGSWSGENSVNGDLQYQGGIEFSAKF